MSSDTAPWSLRTVCADEIDEDALIALYTAVGWSNYTHDPQHLWRAIRGAHFLVIAEAVGSLIGLARTVSDDASIVYIQDILVHPAHHRQGIGRGLVSAILARYPHVRQKVLLTDNRPEQIAFYAALGFQNTRDLTETPLNAFVRIEGATLN